MALAIELFTNLFQAFMFVGFLYLFFDKPQGKYKRLIPFLTALFLVFINSCALTLGGSFAGTEWYYIDSLIAILIMIIYALFFLKGSWYLKVIMPIIGFGINAVVSYTFSYFVSFVTGIPIEESLVISTSFRYLCLVAVNLTTALFLWLVVRLGSNRIKLSSGSEIMAFTVLPVMCIIVMYCNFFAYQVSGFDADIMPYLLVICFVMVVISVVTCIMLSSISKSNELKTEYLLTAQREKLYEESIMASNEQIEKISRIKHETKNKMSSIKKLVSEKNIDEAVSLCDVTLDNLRATYTPIHTSNPVLNAIVNVELEKAASMNIDFSVSITDTMQKLQSSDTISLIGNLCDNAIEYLLTQPKENREMRLSIRSHLDYYIITCSNKISSSVLNDNPKLTTTKTDKESHGKGISVLKDITKSHNGDITFSEENDFFLVTILLKSEL